MDGCSQIFEWANSISLFGCPMQSLLGSGSSCGGRNRAMCPANLFRIFFVLITLLHSVIRISQQKLVSRNRVNKPLHNMRSAYQYRFLFLVHHKQRGIEPAVIKKGNGVCLHIRQTHNSAFIGARKKAAWYAGPGCRRSLRQSPPPHPSHRPCGRPQKPGGSRHSCHTRWWPPR